MIRAFYNHLVSPELRYWLYSLRHPSHIRKLRTKVYPSDKGDFSLAPYTKHKCIFVHITKTAGTSVALGMFGNLPYHYRAWEYRVIFGRKDFAQYYKFAFVRNPWDRLYSAFRYLKGGGWNDYDANWAQENLGHIDDFNEFVEDWLTADRLKSFIHFWPQSDFICDRKNRALIDDIGYFETLNEDFDAFALKLGIDSQLEHINSSSRGSYQSVYSEKAKAKVAELYATDISNFGYTFDGYERKKIHGRKFVDANAQI